MRYWRIAHVAPPRFGVAAIMPLTMTAGAPNTPEYSLAMLRPSVVIAGSVAQRPFVGGHTWVFLQLLLGFRKLGWDVHLIDRLEPGMCIDAEGAPSSFLGSANVTYLSDVMRRAG